MAQSVGENLEKRYVEVGPDAVEVGVHAVERGYKGLPLFPMGVFVGGVFRRQSSAGLCLHSAEVSEESISGRRCTSCQGWDCGYTRLK